MDFFQGVVFTAQKRSLSVTRDKDFFHVTMRLWCHYFLRQSSQQNPYQVYLLSKFDVSSFSVTGDIQIFKLVILLTTSSTKLIAILLTLGSSKLTVVLLTFSYSKLTLSTFMTLDRSHLFYRVGQDIMLQNDSIRGMKN